MDPLDEYRSKRDLATTPEPDGVVAASTDAPRYVIHRHSATSMHWDLRIEHEGVLKSWAIPRGLPLVPGEHHLAVQTEDHPLEYLTFSGDIPAGAYGAGEMVIEDTGTCTIITFSQDKVDVELVGGRHSGRFGLNHTSGRDWLVHRMSPPLDPEYEPLPTALQPMLASPTTHLPAPDDGWVYEPKWDGFRALVTVSGGRLRLQSRGGVDLTPSFPDFAALGRKLAEHQLVFDAELVALDEQGRPSFSRLQRRLNITSPAAVQRRMREVPAHLVIFDLLYLDGRDLRSRAWADRRARLEKLELSGPNWTVTLVHRGDPAAIEEAFRAAGMEGVMAKHTDSPWVAGVRSSEWRKLRFFDEETFTIVGYLPGNGARANTIGSILLVDDDNRYVGAVGTGFSDHELDLLRTQLDERRLDLPGIPEAEAQRAKVASRWSAQGRRNEPVWARPDLKLEVQFHGRTEDGLLRQPVARGIRVEQVSAAEPGAPVARRKVRSAPPSGAVDVQAGGRIVRLTNLEKPLYPDGTTKAQVIEYLTTVATTMLPHLDGRALTMKRYPDGVREEHFYEKAAPIHRPDWVTTVPVHSQRVADPTPYICVQELATLVWLGNLAALELHVPLARARTADQPDILAFDLDPGPGVSVFECAEVALLIRDLIGPKGLGLNPVAKLSGSKGMQIYASIAPEPGGFELSKHVARSVATTLQRAHPDLVVSRMTRSLRENRVLIDWSQNDAKKTTIAVYSPRAIGSAPQVSAPITWGEVTELAARQGQAFYGFAEVAARIAQHGDLFAPVLAGGPPLTSC